MSVACVGREEFHSGKKLTMRLAIVHLSDIHIRRAGNPILEVTDQLVSAVNSSDSSVSLFLVVLSGDIAYSGKPAEYEVALRLFRDFRQRLKKMRPDATVEYISVPGNHDCVLLENQAKLRRTIIQGVVESLQAGSLDAALLKQALKVQAPYNRFRKRLSGGSAWNGVCQTLVLSHDGKNIQVNLYNTALLSQRREQQGTLFLPIKAVEEQVTLRPDIALSISVFHHSYLWLESEVAIAFRSHIERTSDIALTGHQHYSHKFYKENSTGERVIYVESPALQDENYAKTSAFRVLLFDWESQREKVIEFRRSRNLYRPTKESEWRLVTINRTARAEFRLNDEFEKVVNELGTPLSHPIKGFLKLRDVFVYPDLTVRGAGLKLTTEAHEIRGEDVLAYVSRARRLIFQAPSLSGKSSLAKMLFSDIFRTQAGIPILMRGRELTSTDEHKVLAEVWNTFTREYRAEMLDEFRQLTKTERVLIIDDWHRTGVNSEGRREILKVLSQYFDRIFLFTDEVFQIHELLASSTEMIFEFEQATLGEFGHVLRGKLIDKWVTFGREYTGNREKITREIEEKERLIQSMMGKNTLPSLPFVVLCLLEADAEGKAEVPEAGSFGYLYEVLVTVALSQSAGPNAQLEKKYTFLGILAYRMFKEQTKSLSLTRVKEIAEQYSKSHFVKLDFNAMISDLEQARVFVDIGGEHAFAYPHLFYYFVARYYRDNLDRQVGLRNEIDEMVDNVSSDEYSSVLMFIVYFARHSTEIIKRLVANANRIYATEELANLESDVAYLNSLTNLPDVVIPDENVDIDKARRERREMQDKMRQNERQERSERKVVYEEDLADKEKFDLAYRHVSLLGQVIRNFPASLPGPDKLEILKATYLLGLRVLRTLLRMLQKGTDQFRTHLADAVKAKKKEITETELNELANVLLLLLSRIFTLSVVKTVSLSVGVADLEEAYKEALNLVGRNNATQLIDVSIKLDHFPKFPIDDIRALHKEFSSNSFAYTILGDLVAMHMMVFDVDRRLRQNVAALFKLRANLPSMIDSSKKKLKS